MRTLRWAVVAGLLLWASGPAAAFDWELTPIAGFQFGGELEDEYTGVDYELDEEAVFGLIADFDLSPEEQIEVYFSRQETELTVESGEFSGESLFDVDVNYLHVGGVLVWDGEVVKPFVVATMGLTYFDPSLSGGDDEVDFSMSLGGGVKIMPWEHLGLRLEARGFGTFVDSSTSIFVSDGAQVFFTSDLFLQAQVTAGIVFRF